MREQIHTTSQTKLSGKQIDKTVPGLLDVIPFLSLDVAIFVVLQLNRLLLVSSQQLSVYAMSFFCINLSKKNKIVWSRKSLKSD